LAIADVVSLREVSSELKKQAELWAGCIAGTISIEEYTNILKKLGFKNVQIEPVYVYTKSIIEALMKEKQSMNGLKNIDLDLVDGAFAGAHIKAYK